jgi:hypothetical protein
MAELEVVPSPCCAPQVQEDCCAPEAKSTCCSPDHESGCGCSANLGK